MYKHIFKYLLFILTFCLINSYAKISFGPVAGSKTGMKEAAPDTLKILAVRVEFEDDDLDFTTGTGKFDSGYPDTLMIDGTPHDKAYFEDQLEFVKNYFEAVSGGKVQVSTYTVLDRIDTLTHPIWYYNQNNGSEVLLEKLLEMYSDTWNAVKDDVLINFSDYNTFVIFHAGSGQEFNPGYDETPFDIPSVYLSSADLESVKVTAHDGTVINNAVILPECEWQIFEDNWYHAGMGGISCLMFAHRLGIPNLYSSDDGRSCIGKFGLMDQGSANFYGMMPSGVSAWVKELKGWADVRTVGMPEDGITVASDSTICRIDLNNDEYLLIENRTPVNYTSALNEIYGYDRDGRQIRFFYDEEGSEDYEVDAGFKTLVRIDNDDYDFGLPTGFDLDYGDIIPRNKGGLLVWHIDSRKTTDYNIENNQVNDDYSHRGVYLEEADGSFDIGKDYWLLDNGYGTELGWFYDAFSSENEYWKKYPNSNLNSVEFSSVSYPRADTNDGIQAGIKLSGFSIIGREMSFSFSYEDEENYFSIDTELGAAVYLPAYPGGEIRHFFTAADGTFKIFEGDSLALSGILAGPVSTDQLPVFNLNSAILCGADSLSIVTYGFNDGSSSVIPVSGRINGQIKGTVIPTDNGLEIRDSGFSLLDVFGSVTDVSELSVLTDGSGEPLFICGISGSEFFYSDLSEAPYGLVTEEIGAGNRRTFITRNDLFEDITPVYYDRDDNGRLLLTLSDIDRDGKAERIVSENSTLFLLNSAGYPENGFPSDTGLSDTVYSFVYDTGTEKRIVSVDGSSGYMITGPEGGSLMPTPLTLNGSGANTGIFESGGNMYIYNMNGHGILTYHLLGSGIAADHRNAVNGVVVLHDPAGSPVSGTVSGSVYNWPNPARGDVTNFRFFLNEPADVKIDIYDINGNRVETLKKSFSGSGDWFEIEWNVSSVPSGVYRAVLDFGSEKRKVKAAVIK